MFQTVSCIMEKQQPTLPHWALLAALLAASEANNLVLPATSHLASFFI
jgi:hypothetical protein